MSLYEEDAYLFYITTAQLLREKKFNSIDIENAAEELESMGKSEKAKLESFLTILFLHLLKWKYQSAKKTTSWECSIKVQRMHATDHLKDNPSLKGYIEEIVQKSYKYARLMAAKETRLALKIFPEKMPWTLEEAMQEDWLP